MSKTVPFIKVKCIEVAPSEIPENNCNVRVPFLKNHFGIVLANRKCAIKLKNKLLHWASTFPSKVISVRQRDPAPRCIVNSCCPQSHQIQSWSMSKSVFGKLTVDYKR